MEDSNNKNNIWLLLAIIFGIILLIIAIVGIWYAAANPSTQTSCTNINQCTPTEICSNGVCMEQLCTLNIDCPIGQVCSNNFCTELTCINNTDCPNGSVCANQGCVSAPTGTCLSSTDCQNGTFICNNGRCVQCQTDSDCANSGICGIDGICYPNCDAVYVNAVCQNGDVCIDDFCCPNISYGPKASLNGDSSVFRPDICDEMAACNSGAYCVNNKCTCAPGRYMDVCIVSSDCASNNCIAGLCANSNDVCLYNNISDTSMPGYCPNTSPYCANGTCSTSAIGAPCFCFVSEPHNTQSICSKYNSCNDFGNDTVSYCVNNVCSITPGGPNAMCTSNSDCAPVNSGIQKCDAGRCS